MLDNCLIVAGEKSGEEHALTFMNDLIQAYPGCKFWGVGGNGLTALGVECLYNLEQFSSMGFSEVINKVPFYINALKKIVNQVKLRNCKAAILIDFQDFNLRLAKKLKKLNVKVLYYVAPQAWAWKSYRAKIISECVEHLFCILPFEESWFKERGVNQASFIGHPLLEKYRPHIPDLPPNNEPYNIAILPGSRKQEVSVLLPVYLEVMNQLKNEFNVTFSLIQASSLPSDYLTSFYKYFDKVYTDDQLESALEKSHLALATSGTVTLITAQKGLPTIVCYQTSLLNEFIFHTFIKYKGFISLANILAEEEIFPELKQENVSSHNILKIMKGWLQEDNLKEIREKLKKLQSFLIREKKDASTIMKEVLGGV